MSPKNTLWLYTLVSTYQLLAIVVTYFSTRASPVLEEGQIPTLGGGLL
jgi:hypothetical protein